LSNYSLPMVFSKRYGILRSRIQILSLIVDNPNAK
jgi:hypothetical protein